MKLASYKDGSRDGQLVVVSRDLSHAHFATGIATRLQQVLDDWNFLSPQLEDLSTALNQGRTRHAFAFDPTQCMAPLPRAYQWVKGSAYPHHEAMQRQARAGDPVARPATDPLLSQGTGDALFGPRDPIVAPSEKVGIDFEAGVAAITGDVPMSATAEQGLDGVRLLMLANDIAFRQLAPHELSQGFGFVQSRPGTAFSPVAVTPDELGAAWREGRIHLNLEAEWNGKRVGLCDAGADMALHFGQLIAHLAKTRAVRAGSIVGAGAVSSADPAHGFLTITDKRARETLDDGSPKTAYMRFGDTIRIDMRGADQHSVCGAIEQVVESPTGE